MGYGVGIPGQTEHEIATMIYRAKRHGLNQGQMSVLRGLHQWFQENPDGPTITELAAVSGVSRAMVWWTLAVFEELGYVTCSRRKNGHRISRSIRLWVDPDSLGGA